MGLLFYFRHDNVNDNTIWSPTSSTTASTQSEFFNFYLITYNSQHIFPMAIWAIVSAATIVAKSNQIIIGNRFSVHQNNSAGFLISYLVSSIP